MDDESRQTLLRLMSTQRTASLGTLHNGSPFVSLVLFAPAPGWCEFSIHISRLAHHTQDLMSDPRASLMIAEADLGEKDPQTLARISLSGAAHPIPVDDPGYAAARQGYLERFPQAAFNFTRADFSLYRFTATGARYVADFGKIYNLKPGDLRLAAAG